MPRNKSQSLSRIRKRMDVIDASFMIIAALVQGDKVIKAYADIVGLDATKIRDWHDAKYFVDIMSRKMWAFQAMTSYLASGCNMNYLRDIDNFSEQQRQYITFDKISHTRLIACAGSGKTRSILSRIRFMVQHGMVSDKRHVYAITFSKAAATDFVEKIQHLFPNDYRNYFVLKNFCTIDSLAKTYLSQLRAHKSTNVEILSIAFRNLLLQTEDVDTLRQVKTIDHLFIDEAQDLSGVQYHALVLIANKLGTKLHLVGDPNQNIYQFRRSDSRYLLNFHGRHFDLSLNFRSSSQIIAFAEALKPIATLPSKSATNRQGPPVQILNRTAREIHAFIVKFILEYPGDKSEIAIIAPTRGIKTYNTVGLSVIFNLLKQKGIAVNQLYDEAGRSDERRRDLARKSGCVNLLTYHGTKGLEFQVVFVMDFYQNLTNIRPLQSEHNVHRYLLYVAVSRAINQLFVCAYTTTHSGDMNQWLRLVPPNCYQTQDNIQWSPLVFRQPIENIVTGITDIISSFDDSQLDALHDMIHISHERNQQIYADFSNIDRGKDETLFGIFCENLLYLMYSLSRRETPNDIPFIQKLITSQIVVLPEQQFNLVHQFFTKNNLDWATFDVVKFGIDNRAKQVIESHFDRSQKLEAYIVCNNSFVEIIRQNMPDITTTYARYLHPEAYHYDYENIITDFLYLVCVEYAYKNNHYSYVENHGADKQYLLQNGRDLFQAMMLYVTQHYALLDIKPKVHVTYDKTGLTGEIDYLELRKTGPHIVEVKTVREISIKYFLQILVYNFCYQYMQQNLELIFEDEFTLLNVLTGMRYEVRISVSPADMFNILVLMAEVGNMTFRKMNLVYDLETTDKFRELGPMASMRQADMTRGKIFRVGEAIYVRSYPAITEIAIRDYDTNMIIIDSLVAATQPIHPEVVKLTGINEAMLDTAPTLDQIREILMLKTKKFMEWRLISHNGSAFDDLIVTFDKLFDMTHVGFLDTRSLISTHMPQAAKSLALSALYRDVMGCRYEAHRALADVDAIIAIMRRLDIHL